MKILNFKYLSVLPLIAFTGVFLGLPLVQLVIMAFGDVTLRAGTFTINFVGFENFNRMLGDELFLNSIRVTLVFTVAAVLLTLLFGTVIAIAVDGLTRHSVWIQNIVVWPAIVTPVVISVIWLLILSPQIGLLNKIFEFIGLEKQIWLGEPTPALIAVIAVDVWHWTPVVFLFVYTALKGVDSSILEAAKVDGATYFVRLKSVVLPLIVPALIAAAALRVVMSVKAFDEMYLLTFGGPANATSVITIYLKRVFLESFDYGYGAALSLTVVLMVLMTLLVMLGGQRILRRRNVE